MGGFLFVQGFVQLLMPSILLREKPNQQTKEKAKSDPIGINRDQQQQCNNGNEGRRSTLVGESVKSMGGWLFMIVGCFGFLLFCSPFSLCVLFALSLF
jgi:hypothetical protein